MPQKDFIDKAVSPLDVDLDEIQNKIDLYLAETESLNKDTIIQESKFTSNEVFMKFDKVKDMFKRVFSIINRNKLTFGTVAINILIILTFVGFYKPTLTYEDLVNHNVFSDREKRENAKKMYAYVRDKEFDRNEMLFAWVKLVGKWRYQIGGSNQFGVGDCVGAVDYNLEYWGSLLPREDVRARVKRFEKLRELGRSTKISSTYALKPFDVIFIQTSMNNPSHEALIFDVTPAGQIRYLDVNVYNKGWNLNTITMGDPKIYAIYEMTIEAWLAE